MRTTVDIDDEILKRMKQEASERGTPLSAVANDLLRESLARRDAYRDTRHVVRRLDLGGLRPGVTLDDNTVLRDLLDQE